MSRRPPPAPAIVRALDANHDGVIDEIEIEHASAALRSLDRNGDGKLTPDEFIGPRAGRPSFWRDGGPPGRGPRPARARDGEPGQYGPPYRHPGFGPGEPPGGFPADNVRPGPGEDEPGLPPPPGRLRGPGRPEPQGRQLPPVERMDRRDEGPGQAPGKEERPAARRRAPQSMAQAAPSPAGDLGARPTPEELMEKYDLDKDGKLNEAELAAMLKDLGRPRAGHRPPVPDEPRPPAERPPAPGESN